ncbi:TRAP transporter small permease subunit [Martelella lutilitoris]|uniref:TRAP transporter small permease protein n=1 Tax=Martelella lutilitoris TaxID=2583532 RepID=A0A5C4JSM7_9HYPH|nr:TRAP transporter small permease subunit [Martelella lutilitoris]
MTLVTLLNEAWSIIAAIPSWDSWTISETLGTNGAWLVGLVVTLLGGLLVAVLYARFPALENHFEKSVMIWSYLLIAAIIGVEVVRRFVFSVQAPWSTTLPPFLFLIMSWAGCAYNLKFRNHLSFAEFRSMMPRTFQFACLVFDAVLWLTFSWVVVVTSTRVVFNSAANFQILLGTDNVMQWWLLISVPISFILIAGRAIENLAIDYRRYKNGADLISASAQFGD